MSTIAQRAKRALHQRRETLTRLRSDNLAGEQEADQARPADWPDAAVERETSDVLNRLAERERLELRDIDAALARIEAGSYGLCEKCSGVIGRQRLAAVPDTRFCVNCETMVEGRT
jgi:DnaK suppressor protein